MNLSGELPPLQRAGRYVIAVVAVVGGAFPMVIGLVLFALGIRSVPVQHEIAAILLIAGGAAAVVGSVVVRYVVRSVMGTVLRFAWDGETLTLATPGGTATYGPRDLAAVRTRSRDTRYQRLPPSHSLEFRDGRSYYLAYEVTESTELVARLRAHPDAADPETGAPPPKRPVRWPQYAALVILALVVLMGMIFRK